MNKIVVFSLFCMFSAFNGDIDSTFDKSGEVLSRIDRALHVPHQTGPALEVAVAVPIDNGQLNVFLSFCFATNFGIPEYDAPPDGIDPPIGQTIYGDSRSHHRKTRNLTRRKFYRVLSDNLKERGFNAKYCVLKAICEVVQYQFSSENGVLGDLIHILFTPSTSKAEDLPSRYYEAEANGHLRLCERKYGNKCPVSLFDLISIVK